MVLGRKLLYAKSLGGQAISEQDEHTDKTKPSNRRKPWYIRWWAWCLWVLLTLILLTFGLGLWAWTQRYALLEDKIIESLADSGFDADLDVISITRTQANVKNIILRRNGQDILAIEDVSADYIWPDIREGKLQYVELESLTANLNLDEAWELEDWITNLLPEKTNSNPNTSDLFPENGISLKDATLNLSSPLGETTLYIDANIPTAKNFSSEITLAPSEFSYGGYAAKGAGFVTLEKHENTLRLIGQTQTETFSNDNVEFTKAHLQTDGTFDLDTHAFKGSLSLDGDSLTSELFASGPVHLSWDGEISPQPSLQAVGTWSVTAEAARSSRPDRAVEVAKKLSLATALSKVPVTEHYASTLQDTVLELLTGSDVAGQGHLKYGPEGFTVNPVGDFKVKSSRNAINLKPRIGQNFYKFDKNTGMISAEMDAGFEAPVGLSLTDINLRAASNNGLRLNGVRNFSARLGTHSDWHATDSTGRPARLGPITAKFEYKAGQNPRHVTVETSLDYDGRLPGGYVEGLTLDGRLDARIYQTRQELDFTAKPNSLISLKSLETPTAWRGEDIRFTLSPTKNFFVRNQEQSTLAANLNQADFTLTHPITETKAAQRLDLQSANLSLEGTIFSNQTQTWAAEFTDVEYLSETLPGPQTTGSAPQASFTAHLAPNESPNITVNSPSITAKTPQVSLSDIEFTLQGTPDAYEVEHKGGTISLIGSEFADTAQSAGLGSFPANGTITFDDESFSGKANLTVAKANNAEVNVDYTFADGAGTMDIDVPSILFEPKGLQPQNLIPAFQGKIARVDGEARAKLRIAFSDGIITSSDGTLQLVDVGVGTAPGPITGLNSTMKFTSLLPLETSGQQTLTMASFNPGFPLENGVLTFSFVEEGVKVDAADWPIGNGSFSLDPFTWIYAADENRVIMRVKDVALGDFLNDLGNKKIEATGNVVGTFPIVVRGIEVLIENGEISVPDGGLIKYDPGPNSPTYTESEAIDILRQRRTQEYATLAQDALREFRYKELSASLDGPLSGDIEIGLIFDGSNEKVLNRQPFRFDVTVKGELFNIARSFNSNAQVKAEIMRQNGALPEGTIIGE